MKVLIVGYYTEDTVSRIREVFPREWEVTAVQPGEEKDHIQDTDILIPEHIKVDEELLGRAARLKLVQTGAGYDNVDIEACTRHGVRAANAAGVNADAVAEHTFAMILGYYKNLPFLDTFMKQRRDEKLLYYNGAELKGRTIGIIGIGAIGRRVAAYCNAMGIHVLGYDPFVKECADYITLSSLEELLKTSDIITVHVYLNEETRHMFSRETFEKMKNTALLVNTARGGIVCQEDLIEALKTGQIGGACLDVFEEEPLPVESELRDLPNVILTPHTAGMPEGLKFHKTRYEFFRRNIEAVMEGKEVESKLN